MAKMEAARAGCPEAIMLTREGYLAEMYGGQHLPLLRRQTKNSGAPSGNTGGNNPEKTIIDLAEAERIPLEEGVYNRTDLYLAGRGFFYREAERNSSRFTEADGRTIGSGKAGQVSLKLREAFQKLIRE